MTGELQINQLEKGIELMIVKLEEESELTEEMILK